MKLITYTVGPLVAADDDGYCLSQTCGGAFALAINGAKSTGFDANDICASQTPSGAGDLTIDGALASGGVAYLSTPASVTITSAGNDSSRTFTVYGQVYTPGGTLPIPGSEAVTGANTSSVSTRKVFVNVTRVAISGAAAAGVTVGPNGTATMDKPRRVLITSGGNDSSITFAVYGTDWNGNPISDTLTGTNGSTVQSLYDFATLTAVWPSAAVATTVIVGTSGVASSRPIFFDGFTNSPTAIQADVTGTANFTVQQTLNNPNDIGYANTTWVNHPDSALAAATATAQGNYAYLPFMTRLTLNSGTGSVRYSVQQASSPQ